MLTYVSKHNSLAQAARVAEAAVAGITLKAQNPRRFRFPGEDGCIVFLDTNAMTAFKVTGEEETTAAEVTPQRVASRRPKVCLQKIKSWSSGLSQYDSKPRFKSVKKPASMFDSNLYEGTTALFGVIIILSTPLIVLLKF